MSRRVTWGNTRLGSTGLVAVMGCGHWWVYQVRATVEQMHDLARFNHGLACSFCLAAWQAATRPQAHGASTRLN